MVSAQDAERLLPLHQREEVICHRLTVEKVVHAKEEVPVQIKDRSDETVGTHQGKALKLTAQLDVCDLPDYTLNTTDANINRRPGC